MQFKSAKTEKGNVGYSVISQEAADNQALQMDRDNCYNCNNCNNCTDCNNCDNCTNCNSCYNCDSCDKCHNCINCDNCNSCNSCTNCNKCTDCADCNKCANCHSCADCKGALIWKGNFVTALFTINGLFWSVSISETHMQIGCQCHSHEDWTNFTDSHISGMHSEALSFWKQYKDLLMSACKLKAAQK